MTDDRADRAVLPSGSQATGPVLTACLTPPGTGAIATVALWGPHAWQLIEPLFHPRSRVEPEASPAFLVGQVGDAVRDRVVITRETAGAMEWIAIHCHGGVTAVRWLMDLLADRGATATDWQAWLRDRHPSTLQADAAVHLPHAPTPRTAAILLDQYHGTLERTLAGVLADLESVRADGGDSPESGEQEAIDRGLQRLDDMLGLAAVGLHLVHPWRVVVGGDPNVGKSSLINALLGFQRAITSPAPGTTRDILTARTAIAGWPVELVDTAGQRESAEGVEALGIAAAREACANADLCLWVVDGSRDAPLAAPELPCPVLHVVNKCDLPRAWTPEEVIQGEWLPVSAMTTEGLEGLLGRIAARLAPRDFAAGAAVPFTMEQVQILAKVRASLSAGALADACNALRSVLRPRTV